MYSLSSLWIKKTCIYGNLYDNFLSSKLDNKTNKQLIVDNMVQKVANKNYSRVSGLLGKKYDSVVNIF